MDRVGKIVIASGGGFIGGDLVILFIRQGHSDIRVVDCKALDERHQVFPEAENICADLR
jgi:hypothetical protein